MIVENETIAAIATATGPAGVGVVRLSGDNAIAVAAQVCRTRVPLSEQPSTSLRRVEVTDASGEILDDGLVAVFRTPNSFTGENVVEIQGHGGSVTLSRVLNACLAAGARAARPGEFSERAFVNGKLDLAQAEAVAAMVSAQTVTAQRVARQQLSGTLSRTVNEAGGIIQEALARIEASIDFPEEVGEIDAETVTGILLQAEEVVSRLLATAGYGRRLNEGITLVLAGRPNVGKSSLLNALAGRDRAIVSPIAGTTRDVVEETLNVGGIPVRALDTAGIRDTEDTIERIGVERARTAVADADVVVAVLDATAGLTEDDRTFLQNLNGRAAVIAINKADLADTALVQVEVTNVLPGTAVVAVAAATGAGLAGLSAAVVQAVTGSVSVDTTAPLVTEARHADALRRTATSLSTARQTLMDGLPAELIAVDAHAAMQALGEITGTTAREEIIAGIFSRFCIGK